MSNEEAYFEALERLGEETLEHYGVKGMKWGVITEDDRKSSWGSLVGLKTTPASAAQKAAAEVYKKGMVPPPKPSKKEMAKNFEENQVKSLSKLDPSGADGTTKGGLTREQKIGLAKVAVGVAVIGGLYYAGNKAVQNAVLEGHDKNSSVGRFLLNTHQSKMKTWTVDGNYIQPSSWGRPEFELPAGHTFHRLSRGLETDFNVGTYATHNLDDFKRYVAGFSGELGDVTGLNHVTWTSKTPTKVPNLATVLESTREILQEDAFARTVTPQEALNRYQRASGGGWNDSFAKALFENLQKKGYGALVDEMDAGVIGETPLVVFARDQMNPKSATPISKKTIDDAYQTIKDIPRPPRKPS